MAIHDSRSGPKWLDGVDFGTEAWVLSGQWNPRPDDDVNTFTERMRTCVTGLAEQSALLKEWYYDDEPIEITPSGLTERFDERWQEFSGDGHEIVLTVWNGVTDDPGFSRVSISRESTADKLRRGMQFVAPVPAALPGLYRQDAMLDLFEIMLSSWGPQWCRVHPLSVEEASEGETVDVLASWIVYLERDVYVQKGELPGEVRVKDSADGKGRFFILAPTPEEIRLGTVEGLRECLEFPEEWGLLR